MDTIKSKYHETLAATVIKNLKKMISYYKPYLGVFWADMFFATVSAAVALVIPLVIRYVTSTLIYMEPQAILGQMEGYYCPTVEDAEKLAFSFLKDGQ